MEKSRREIVADYCEKIRSGEIEYSNLRAILEANKYSGEDIQIIAQRVDRDLQRMAVIDSEKAKGKQMLIGGIVIMILGIAVTISSYMGLIDLGDRFIIAYGPALGGLGLALIGIMKMNR